MLNEFKEFALRGNVLDLAVGVIVGGAFGNIVKSLVDDVVMPPVGLLVGGVDFAKLAIVIPGRGGQPVAINIGLFLNATVNFLIIAFAVFLLVRQVNRLMRKPVTADQPKVVARECPYCMSMVPARARRCAHCTSSLEALA
jgi:large conductance mechanosensitive channel